MTPITPRSAVDQSTADPKVQVPKMKLIPYGRHGTTTTEFLEEFEIGKTGPTSLRKVVGEYTIRFHVIDGPPMTNYTRWTWRPERGGLRYEHALRGHRGWTITRAWMEGHNILRDGTLGKQYCREDLLEREWWDGEDSEDRYPEAGILSDAALRFWPVVDREGGAQPTWLLKPGDIVRTRDGDRAVILPQPPTPPLDSNAQPAANVSGIHGLHIPPVEYDVLDSKGKPTGTPCTGYREELALIMRPHPTPPPNDSAATEPPADPTPTTTSSGTETS
ncbi:hypothetical protein [Nocardia noduli]|uniref:hypothetical protein n=1 Tax=Nocardia noduli TaxID=2815722 RepID=UPI001C2209A9|nr:hypothetical protein [Nocardia noduli]